MGKFFTVTAKPDVINGDISVHVGGTAGSPAAATDMDANDLVFDWTSVDVPKGTNLLRSVSVWINGEDGGIDDLESYEFIFAKAVDGVAPPSIGTIGGAVNAGHLRHHLIGSFILDNTDGETITVLPVLGGNLYTVTGNVAAGTPNMANALPFVIDTEGSSTSAGYDKLYIAGTVKAARNFGTATLANQATYDASAHVTAGTTVNTVITDGTDARLVFSVGDQVYDHMSDTPIPGTLTKVEQNLLTFTDKNTTVDITENNELINANPIRINLGFEK